MLFRRPAQGRVIRTGTRPLITPVMAAAGIAVVVSLVALVLFFSRAQSIYRLLEISPGEESRFEYWTVAYDMAETYFPIGSGAGSFADAYRIFEPDKLLNFTYLNRAHNDFLETAVTYGLPGIALILFFLGTFVVHSIRVWRPQPVVRRSLRFARLVTVLGTMMIFASIPDYPLRTPIMMSLAALFALWLAAASEDTHATPPHDDGAQQ